MKADDITKAFGCPERCAFHMEHSPTRMHRAILAIGPGRVQYLPGTTTKLGMTGMTCWSLDGIRASEDQLFEAEREAR